MTDKLGSGDALFQGICLKIWWAKSFLRISHHPAKVETRNLWNVIRTSAVLAVLSYMITI